MAGFQTGLEPEQDISQIGYKDTKNIWNVHMQRYNKKSTCARKKSKKAFEKFVYVKKKQYLCALFVCSCVYGLRIHDLLRIEL